MKILLSGIAIVLVAISGYLFLELRSSNKLLSEANEVLKMREAALAEIKKKSEVDEKIQTYRAKTTPTAFGFYAYELGPEPLMRKLQYLRPADGMFEGQLGKKYTETAEVVFKTGNIGFVLYHRMFSMAAPEHVFVHIFAQVKGEEAWVMRNRGHKLSITPRTDNRDMLMMSGNLPPGRYAIRLEGVHTFQVAGEVTGPDYCVTRNAHGLYDVCPGGTP